MDSNACHAILAVAVSYLIGAIPFSFTLPKVVKGIDIRTVGSGNIGATNVGRVMGRAWGVLAYFLDVAKGFTPVCLAAVWLDRFHWGGVCPPAAVILCGAAAICGHIWPVYLKFRGGKGVATSSGVLLYLEPVGTLVALAIWVIAVAIWRYVSLASILAAIALVGYVLLTAGRRGGDTTPLILFAIAMAAIVIVRHRSNIKRLLNGTENRIGGGKRKEP